MQKKEEACGCIPYRIKRNGEIEALLVLREKGFWEFPKGKKEKGESDLECALREMKEETGLSGTLSSQEPIALEYLFSKNEEKYKKHVLLFLCLINAESEVCVDNKEIVDFVWLTFSEAESLLTYKEMKRGAREAHERLKTQFEER